jgi:hypothetical protein
MESIRAHLIQNPHSLKSVGVKIKWIPKSSTNLPHRRSSGAKSGQICTYPLWTSSSSKPAARRARPPWRGVYPTITKGHMEGAVGRASWGQLVGANNSNNHLDRWTSMVDVRAKEHRWQPAREDEQRWSAWVEQLRVWQWELRTSSGRARGK